MNLRDAKPLCIWNKRLTRNALILAFILHVAITSVEDVEYARLHLQTKPAIAKLVSLDALVHSVNYKIIGNDKKSNSLLIGGYRKDLLY